MISFDAMRDTAVAYWSDLGAFVYDAYGWENSERFDNRIALPMIQVALTPHGGCIGMTNANVQRPVITIHPSSWGNPDAWGGIPAGRRYVLDIVIHEMTHVSVQMTMQDHTEGVGPWKSSHDNPIWCEEVNRMSPLLGINGVKAAPTVRRRADGRMLRRAPDGCTPMSAVSRWPYSVRDPQYYRSEDLP